MKLAIRYFSFLIIIALYFGSFAHAQKKSEREDLPNFAQVNAMLYRSGQPTEAGIKQLEGKVKTIVYLRGADERADTERKWAEAAHINFQPFPLNNWFGPKDSQIKNILDFINDPQNQPVLVHCKRGADRTGTVIAVYRISSEGITAKEAIVEAKRFHMGWWQFWMKDYINDYYRDFKK
jgi:protein tyrosine/serine phosphatase